MNDERRRAALTGELGQVPLWDILQTLQVWPTAGLIEVDGSHELATLHIHAGRIVEARCGLRRGEAAVYRALRLRRGHFTVRRTRERDRAPLALPIMAAILEGVRRHDECDRLRAALPGEEELLFWRGGRVPADLRGSSREAAELFVVPRTIDDAIRASGEDELALLEQLVVLRPRLSSRTVPAVATSLSASIERQSALPPLEEAAPSPSDEPPHSLSPSSGPCEAAVRPPPLHDDYELVSVEEEPSHSDSHGEEVHEQSTLEPFTYLPELVVPSARPPRSARLPPRVLAVLASAATLASFVLTLAVLVGRSPRLSPLAPEVARWMSEAWPCDAHDPPPPPVAALVCR